MPIKSLILINQMKFWQYVVLAAFLFVCMYDPKSGGLEQYIGATPGGAKKPCCDEAPIGRQCGASHSQSVQFAEPGMGCPRETPQAKGGAIYNR